MALSQLTSTRAVMKAITEFDRLGRDRFLEEYGFGRARKYFLEYNGRLYDSKAIAGVAYGFQRPSMGPLSCHDFSGGARTVKVKLEELGFEVRVA